MCNISTERVWFFEMLPSECEFGNTAWYCLASQSESIISGSLQAVCGLLAKTLWLCTSAQILTADMFFFFCSSSIWVPGLKQWYCLLWHWVMFLFSSSLVPLTFNFIFVYWSHTKAGIYFPLLLTSSPVVGTHWWNCSVRTPRDKNMAKVMSSGMCLPRV